MEACLEKNKRGKKTKTKLKNKNDDKVRFLVDKYGERREKVMFGMTDEEIFKYGKCDVFSEEGVKVETKVYEPIIVNYLNKGKIEVNDDERDMLRLGQKFCVMGNVEEENCVIAVEECVTKLKWEVMGENMKKAKEDPAMAAINEVIDQEQREELKDHERQVGGEATNVFLVREGISE